MAPKKQGPAKTPPGRSPRVQEPSHGRVAVGRVLRPWGTQGELKVEPLTDFVRERFAPGARLWAGANRHTIAGYREHQGQSLVRFEDVRDRNAAEELRGELLEVAEEELASLPPDTYYRHDLLGLAVITTGGERLGEVTEVLDTGANEVFVVAGEGWEILVPAIGDVVTDVDVPGGRIVIEPTPGLLPEERGDKS
ncbi:MAG TPA: ribosome maturation factor RimM [Dehalococcoidia bacterium]|nr:ribosome maturation factor RimM [Dehalococcoidia bacterium]